MKDTTRFAATWMFLGIGVRQLTSCERVQRRIAPST